MPADLERLAAEQSAAAKAYQMLDDHGERSRGAERWAEDWLAEEAMVRGEGEAE
jgi:hypothetical protein